MIHLLLPYSIADVGCESDSSRTQRLVSCCLRLTIMLRQLLRGNISKEATACSSLKLLATPCFSIDHLVVSEMEDLKQIQSLDKNVDLREEL